MKSEGHIKRKEGEDGEDGRRVTLSARLSTLCPVKFSTSPTRKMGQKGLLSGWKVQLLISAEVIVVGKFPLGYNEFMFYDKNKIGVTFLTAYIRQCVCMCACICLCVTYLVTSKSGKRILFLMKMVKLFTSSIGLLEEDVDREERVRVTIKASNVYRCTFCLSVCLCVCVCAKLTSLHHRSQLDTILQSHIDPWFYYRP